MKRKLLSMILAVTLFAGIMGGCGSSGETKNQKSGEENTEDASEEGDAKKTDSGKRKIVLWTWATGQFDAVYDAYYETHPDTDWEIEEVVVASEDYLTKLQQGYASGGDMPDLLMAEMTWRGSAFALDIWENLEAEPYNLDRSILMDSVISSITNDQDQIIGVENALNPAFMMYKKDMAREYLGTDDRAELESMFQSYDDYVEWGEKVYEQSGGTVTLFPGLQDISNMMMQQVRNINNVDEDGNVNVTDKVDDIFATMETLRDVNACGNLAQYSTE